MEVSICDDLPWEETMDVNEGSRGYSDGYEAAEKAAEAMLAATIRWLRLN